MVLSVVLYWNKNHYSLKHSDCIQVQMCADRLHIFRMFGLLHKTINYLLFQHFLTHFCYSTASS